MTTLAIFISLIFGVMGFGYIWTGRRHGRTNTIVAGVILCVFSYLVFVNTWVFLGVGVLVAALPFLLRR